MIIDHRQPHHKDTGTTTSLSMIQDTPNSRIRTHTQFQEHISLSRLKGIHSNELTSLQITAYNISNMQYRYWTAHYHWSPFHAPSLETCSDHKDSLIRYLNIHNDIKEDGELWHSDPSAVESWSSQTHSNFPSWCTCWLGQEAERWAMWHSILRHPWLSWCVNKTNFSQYTISRSWTLNLESNMVFSVVPTASTMSGRQTTSTRNNLKISAHNLQVHARIWQNDEGRLPLWFYSTFNSGAT